jgi:hypothetical protein
MCPSRRLSEAAQSNIIDLRYAPLDKTVLRIVAAVQQFMTEFNDAVGKMRPARRADSLAAS